MTISNIVTRKLLIAALALATASTFNLGAMKRKLEPDTQKTQLILQKDKDRVLFSKKSAIERWLICKELNLPMPQECKLFPELTVYIFWLTRRCILDDHVGTIIQNYDNTAKKLFDAIKRVCTVCAPDLSIVIICTDLKKAGLPDFYIPKSSSEVQNNIVCKDEKIYVNMLGMALTTSDKEVIIVFLAAADEFVKGWALKLIDYILWTRLDWISYINPEIKQILDQYEPNKK